MLGLVAACGRIDFSTHTVDASAVVDVAIDAPSTCQPLPPTVTLAQCASAFATPGASSDTIVAACALACAWGVCAIHDASGCSSCSCTQYAYSGKLCDPMTGLCTGVLNGTGCIGHNFYAGPPMSCPSTGTSLVGEGACMMRYLAIAGDC